MNYNDLPREVLGGEAIQAHKRDRERIAASFVRAQQEGREGRCAICGAAFDVTPGIVTAVRYTCSHGLSGGNA